MTIYLPLPAMSRIGEREFLLRVTGSTISFVSSRDSEDTMLLIMKEILRLDNFEPEPQYETIEQMIKSNVLNYFVTNQTTKLNELRPYLAKSEAFTKSITDSMEMP